nr:energy-coupling factor transporter transmembrane component T [Maliibacterium massiliense]
MLENITFGQYIPGASVVHRMDPRMKILLVAALIVFVFLAQTALSYAALFGFIFLTAALARIPLKFLLRSVRPLLFIVIFTFVLNIFLVRDGQVLLKWWIFTVTSGGIRYAIFLALRLVLLVMGTSLLTFTTSPIELTDGLERLMRPLRVIHFPAHELAMMITIALRFIPTLLEETDKIMKAQKARGADFESGSLLRRAKALVPLLVPLFINAFRRADELAMAMESRCYHGGAGRTRMKVLHMHRIDAYALLVMAAVGAFVVLDKIYVFLV